MFAMLLPISKAIVPLLPSTAPSGATTTGRKRGQAFQSWMERTVGRWRETASHYRVVINPEIVARSETTELGLEGCLSVPEYSALVRRHTVIDVQYQGVNGELHKERISGGRMKSLALSLPHTRTLCHPALWLPLLGMLGMLGI